MRQTDSGIGRQRAREAKKDKAAACASGNVTDSGKNSGGGKTQDDSCAKEKEGAFPRVICARDELQRARGEGSVGYPLGLE